MRIATWVTLALAPCIAGAAASDRAGPKTHTVTIEGIRFQPQMLTVSRGDAIVWVNKDAGPSHGNVEGRRL